MGITLGVEAQQVVLIQSCSADGGCEVETSMRSVPVVLVDPSGELLFSLC